MGKSTEEKEQHCHLSRVDGSSYWYRLQPGANFLGDFFDIRKVESISLYLEDGKDEEGKTTNFVLAKVKIALTTGREIIRTVDYYPEDNEEFRREVWDSLKKEEENLREILGGLS